MLHIHGLTVCVGYDDLLKITLPTVLPAVDDLTVITTADDTKTLDYIKNFPNVYPLITDAFYRNGAKFNKGLALEEGFEAIGRKDWILVLDADIMLPLNARERLEAQQLHVGRLYNAKRRILHDASDWANWCDSDDWFKLPSRREDLRGHFGYFQLFHGNDPVLHKRPWYGINWTHAGHCDADFQAKWVKAKKSRPDFEVLHIGRCDENWFGRATARLDGEPVRPDAGEYMTMLRQKYGWGMRRMPVTLQEKVVE